jgi:hypothetical protein
MILCLVVAISIRSVTPATFEDSERRLVSGDEAVDDLSFDDVFEFDYGEASDDDEDDKPRQRPLDSGRAVLLPESEPAVRTTVSTWFSLAELESAGSFLSTLARNQAAEDLNNEALAPLVFHNYEDVKMSEETVERLFVGDRIVATTLSTIFSVIGRNDLVIKYQADCDRDTPFHPLLRDHWFLNALSDTGFVPRSYFISPATRYTSIITQKTEFELSPQSRRTCMDAQRTVRFMVMDKVGENLFNYTLKQGGNIEFGIKVMKWLMRSLQEIHDRGFIHGDIHGGNVVFLRPGSSDLGLIDFGLGVYEEEIGNNNPRPYNMLQDVHCYHSLWELYGFRLSFRDDVYKTLLLGAYLINGVSWLDYCQALQQSQEAMLYFKETSFLFEYPGGPKLQSRIRGPLETLLSYVRGNLRDIQDKPDYEYMIRLLNDIPAW